MKIYKLIPAIMGDIGAIEKTRSNTQQNYKFRGIDDVYSALQPLLVKYGVFYIPKVLARESIERQSKSGTALIYTTVTMSFTFVTDDQSFIEVVTVGEAMDSGDKSSNKAMSMALKTAAIQLFCIPTQEDMDTENHSPEVLPRGPMPSTPPKSIDHPTVCARCNTAMKRTQKNDAWYCPNYQDKSRGEHSYTKDHP